MIRCFAVIMLSLLLVAPAHALVDVPTFRLALGKPMMNISAASGTGNTAFFDPGTKIESSFTLNPMFLWDFPSMRTRFGAQFIMDVGSPYGFLTAVGIGATALLYPLGLSSGREKRDDDVDFVKTRLSPYLHAALTPTKVSFTKGKPTGSDTEVQEYFSAIVMETALGAGVDYPLSEDFISFIGLDYRFASFIATSSDGNGYNVSYSGLMLVLGVMTNFY